MSVCRINDCAKFESIKSRLGRSLIRIHQGSEHNRLQWQHAEDLFQNWKKRWEHRRGQISRRLELIEDQLEELSGRQERPPKLAILTGPSDKDEAPAR